MDDSDEANLQRIALLLDELKSENVQFRKNATKKLKIISSALGPERTRCELIPFLTDTIDDEDEILLVLAEELGDFVQQVGGPEYAESLLVPLESLSTVEETVVRDRATRSLREVSDAVFRHDAEKSGTIHVKHFFPLTQRLARGDWFTSRISACSLLACVYGRLPVDRTDIRKECISIFSQLVRDDKPMVRRAAASYLGDMSRALAETDRSLVETEIVADFKMLSEDEQESVRLLLVENASTVASCLSESVQVEVMMPIIRAFSKDKSWRVRYIVADKSCDLCDVFGSKATREELLPAFTRLLKDGEAEVRTAATFKLTDFMHRLVATEQPRGEPSGGEIMVRDVLPIVHELVGDPSQHVRAALSANIMGLPSDLGDDEAVKDLLDLVMILLKDEFPDVRLNLIAKLADVSSVMGVKRLSDELMPTIVHLAEDKNWRVRLAIIEHIPLLAKQLGREIFEEDLKLSTLCIKWLIDNVWSIREAAIMNLKSLAEVFGTDWAKQNIVPQIVHLFDFSSKYLHRITALNAVAVLSEVVGAEVVEDSFISLLTDRASKDPVPNVRFGTAKTLSHVMPFVTPEMKESKIRPCLSSLAAESETDTDVNYFAKQALEKLAANS
mmetsp:Transcript_39252/g.155731  ORF Transcript_39252/g.155731 Transcript_39252/m.155731 type:complete len:616 (-) Transcript_39252:319-2166(-)|eukprot:CAMPEP_0113968372 /NCGR_PEP_ID=MMETSP0011_2-20120614/9494_1 /TAXON_ID=101924 /ORGANISM="Rhodosorus marinus" /LENGTH=615 /DNA_ID=CAMNT_0000981449 /DNA_START=251 /DNA_END=2098 /DNA_ORIENTATION=+ /assembly_acc=CAM_ASM_000156